jgi:glycosyl-4,4'-diaponeurosporenoate acyltransferase
MKLYLSVIGIAMLLISAANVALGMASPQDALMMVTWCTALQFAMDGLIAILINKMPDDWFGVDNPLYRVSQAEKKLYKKLKVRRWKDKVWELGGLGGFSKKNLNDPGNPSYIEKFIVECNKGVLTHRLSYPVGFLAMLTLAEPFDMTVALPVALVNLFLNILPTLALRYNTPKLQAVLRYLQKNEQRAQEAAGL